MKAPPTRLQNLAAKPSQFGDDIEDDQQLVDNSGVFRVTAAIEQAQTGHDEGAGMRFPNDSLVMRAQRDGFRDDGPTLDDALDENRVVDEAARVEKKARLATLVARGHAAKRR
jgi:hypothetical protein